MNTDKIIDYTFSIPSFAGHVLVSISWFVFHLDINLFTNLLSIEAILLSILIGVNQKRHAEDMKAHMTKKLK